MSGSTRSVYTVINEGIKARTLRQHKFIECFKYDVKLSVMTGDYMGVKRP